MRRFVVYSILLVWSVGSTARAQDPVPGNQAQQSPGPVAGQLQLSVGLIETSGLENLKTNLPSGFEADREYVIQFDGCLSAAQRGELSRAGVVLRDYLPAYSYIAELGAARPEVIAKMDFVRWVGGFLDDWKIDPELGARVHFTPERQALVATGAYPVIVTLFAGRAGIDVRDAILAASGVVHWVDTVGENVTISATMRLDAARGLAKLNAVQYVEEAYELSFRNSTTRWIVQSDVTNVTPIYDRGITGTGQIVGVMDGAVNRDHCAFRDAVNNTPGSGHRKIQAYNASFSYDLHGTHVACTAIGQDVNGSTGDTRGIAYGGRLVYGPIPSFDETSVYNAFTTPHGQGARVHTNSWGDDGTTSYNAMCRAVDRFAYDNEDDLVCFAVTNTGTLKNPENAKNLLAVGASQDTPNEGNYCSGTSGTGPTADGRRKPEIYAPGCGTVSASGNGTSCSTTALSGTSMASPAIAGTGLLVRQYYMDGFYPSGAANAADAFTPSGALLKATLLNSAVDMTVISGYPSNREGWGRVLADNALYFTGDARKLGVLADKRNATGLQLNDEDVFAVNVAGASQQLRVTLVWVDPAASASTGTGNAAVNDLDLEVVSPTAALYKGNVFSGGVSTTGGVKDATNNVEQVHVSSPELGNWTVRVRGTAVNVGRQGYALIATGDISLAPPPLSISLSGSAPSLMSPGESVDFDVVISPNAETLVPGTALLRYRYLGGSYLSSPLAPLGGTMYRATLPAADCDDSPEFYVSAQGSLNGIKTSPPGGASAPYTAVVGDFLTALSDDFQTNQGWTTSATATAGQWQRGVPANGNRGDPPSAFGGSGQCYLTQNATGDTDVDGGSVFLVSPVMDMSGSGTVSYQYWLNDVPTGLLGSGDGLRVDYATDAGGTNWITTRTYSTAMAAWRADSIVVGPGGITASATFRIRFVATDTGTGNVVEAAVDSVLAQRFECISVSCLKGDVSGNGEVDGEDIRRFSEVLVGGGGTAAERCAGDVEASPDGEIDLGDVSNFVGCLLNGGCL